MNLRIRPTFFLGWIGEWLRLVPLSLRGLTRAGSGLPDPPQIDLRRFSTTEMDGTECTAKYLPRRSTIPVRSASYARRLLIPCCRVHLSAVMVKGLEYSTRKASWYFSVVVITQNDCVDSAFADLPSSICNSSAMISVMYRSVPSLAWYFRVLMRPSM